MGVPSKLSRLPGACQKVLWWQNFWAKQPPKNWDCDKSTWLLSHQALSFVLLSLQYTADVSVKRVWSTSTKLPKYLYWILPKSHYLIKQMKKSTKNEFFHIYHLFASWWGPIDLQKNIIVLFHVGIGLCTLNWNFTYQFILGI